MTAVIVLLAMLVFVQASSLILRIISHDALHEDLESIRLAIVAFGSQLSQMTSERQDNLRVMRRDT